MPWVIPIDLTKISWDTLSIVVLVVLFLLVGVFVVYLLWRIPVRYISSRRSGLHPREILELENDYRSTFAQIVGGLLVLIGLFFTLSEVRDSKRTFEQNRRGQEAERFSKALDHLTKDGLIERMGGIFALEAIADNNPDDYRQPVLRTFAAYVMVHSPWAPKQSGPVLAGSTPGLSPSPSPALASVSSTNVFSPTPTPSPSPSPSPASVSSSGPPEVTMDIQEVLDFIGRTPRLDNRGRPSFFNLGSINLRKGRLRGNFQYVQFQSVYGLLTDFIGANLNRASFGQGPTDPPIYSFLRCANFNRANLEGAIFTHANLQGAHFENAILKGTVFANADLTDARFQNADLREAQGITQTQIDSAMVDDKTQLPTGIQKTPKALQNKSPKCDP